jgi:hypothetical protein
MDASEHNRFPGGRWSKPTLKEVSDKMDARDVAAKLNTHEEVCAERYGQIRSRLNRLEAILIGTAGTLLLGMAGLVVKLMKMSP